MSTLASEKISTLPRATPISRLLRAALGVGMIGMVAPALRGASWESRLEVLAVVVGLMALYTVVHLVVSRYFGWLHPWIGAVIAVTPVFLLFLRGGVFDAGAVVFIGASLLLIAALGHPGCEVLAFPALVLGRRTHLACVLFSPIDWVEGKVMTLVRGSGP